MALKQLNCEIHSGAGRPLLLIHGFGAYGAFWRKWIPDLSPKYRSYVVDLPGFGGSAESTDPSPEGTADLLARFIEKEMPGERPVLIGHSLGGGIAILTALSLLDGGQANRLSGLVLVSTAIYPQRFPLYISFARTRGLRNLFLVAPPPRWAFRQGLRQIVHDPRTIDDEKVNTLRAPYLSRERRRSLLNAARAIDLGAGERAAPRISQLHVPTLILWGAEDRIVPVSFGRRLARDLPDARLVVLPGIGHLPPEEAPSDSLAHVMDFLGRLK